MVDDFLRKAKDVITGSNKEQDGQHSDRQVRPASEDPLGDPADVFGQSDNVRPASEDPLGDPADASGQSDNVRPASEDPLGDPADQNDNH